MPLIHYIELFAKFLEIIFISSVKFIIAAPLSFLDGFSYMQTIILTAVGGIAGVFFFYYLSGWALKRLKNLNIKRFKDLNINPESKKPFKRKIYTSKNRFIKTMRVKFGLYGIVVLTPVLFSIPLGSIIAKKYYSKSKSILLYLSLSVISWSFIIATLLKFMRT